MIESRLEKNIQADVQQKLFNQEWEKSQANPLIVSLNEGKLLRDSLEELSGFKESFKSTGILDIMECSDGRVNGNKSLSPDEKLGLAGSGILFNQDELKDFVLKNYGKVKVVTSHDECGAGAIKYAQMLEDGEAMPAGVNNSDELAQHFAKRAAELLGADYRHISKAEFSSPVHSERMVVLDGTARFNPNKILDFPPRFMSAALGLGANVDYVAKEAKVLAEISLGDHGFNSRFTAKNPFYIVMFGKNQEQVQEIGDALLNFVVSSEGRVKVIGLVAPEREEADSNS